MNLIFKILLPFVLLFIILKVIKDTLSYFYRDNNLPAFDSEAYKPIKGETK